MLDMEKIHQELPSKRRYLSPLIIYSSTYTSFSGTNILHKQLVNTLVYDLICYTLTDLFLSYLIFQRYTQFPDFLHYTHKPRGDA